MDFLNSAYIHSIIYVSDEVPPEVLEAWGDKPTTVVTSDRSQEFQRELLRSDLETLKGKYEHHLIVLMDAAWTDYEPVFSRTLFLSAQPKLVVMASSLNDGDLLPLLNLARGNDRLPLLFDHTKIEVALRGYVRIAPTPPQRIYVTPLFNPFDPYPVHSEGSTALTKMLFAVRTPCDTMRSFFNFNGALLFCCNTEVKKKDLVRFFVCNGFQPYQDHGLQRGDTVVYVACTKDTTVFQVDQLHAVEPPENLGQAMALARPRSRVLSVYLYVPYTNPFEEPPELKAYRETLGFYIKQAEWLRKKPATLYDAIAGLFVHNPVWSRGALVNRVQSIMPGELRGDILNEMQFLIEEKFVLVDVFEREGYLVSSENMFIYQPFRVPTDPQ